jgi:hypothetical protein
MVSSACGSQRSGWRNVESQLGQADNATSANVDPRPDGTQLLGSPDAQEVHREWGASLRTLGERVLGSSPTPTADLDVRLVAAALDGLRLTVLSAGQDADWLRPAVRRQLGALLG